MKRFIQLIPSHHARDAAGSEVLTLERIMQEAGWQTETYADNVDPELEGRTKLFPELDQDDLKDAVVLYHFCASSEMTWRFLDLDAPRAILFHNITPAHFFESYNKDIAIDCREGRKQLKEMADYVDLAIAHSDYSCRELQAENFEVTRVIPFLYDNSRLEQEVDEKMLERLASDRPVVMFVGRMVPNKAPDDFIRVAQAYHKAGYPPVQFVLIGKTHILPKYSEEVEEVLARMPLEENQLYLTGEVTDAELAACYQKSAAFLSVSRHEGFCVPLVEAMNHSLPVIARAAAAVPETLGESGVLFDTDDPDKIAEMLSKTLFDEEKMELMRKKGRKRLEAFDLYRWSFVFKALMNRFLE
jgi:glycosyltransferase involved in cell wall biosynthesis